MAGCAGNDCEGPGALEDETSAYWTLTLTVPAGAVPATKNDTSNGNLQYMVNGAEMFLYRYATDKLFYNAQAPMGGLGAYVNISDVRTKTNIEPATAGLQAVLALNPVKFERISTGAREVGFVAQEVQGVLPEAVVAGGFGLPDDDEPALAVVSDTIVAALVRAVQELAARVRQLEAAR